MAERRLTLLACLAAALLLTPGAALACKQRVYPDHILDPYDAVVIASVTEARFVDDRQSAFFIWHADLRVARVVVGPVVAANYDFSDAWESALCGRNKPPPSAGELWVLYLKRDGGKLVVSEAYPIDVARRIDGRFGPLLRP